VARDDHFEASIAHIPVAGRNAKEDEMTPSRSLFRAAALTGAAPSLFSFAAARPAATRHAVSRYFGFQDGDRSSSCTVTVPPGKVFIIESATVGGASQPGQVFEAWITTRVGRESLVYPVPMGFHVLKNLQRGWTGAIAGTFFGEPGAIGLMLSRDVPGGVAWARMTLAGRLEDM
jgi:hypothetical protein